MTTSLIYQISIYISNYPQVTCRNASNISTLTIKTDSDLAKIDVPGFDVPISVSPRSMESFLVLITGPSTPSEYVPENDVNNMISEEQANGPEE